MSEHVENISTAVATEKKFAPITLTLVWCGLVVVSSLYITIPLVSTFTDSFGVSQSQAAWTTSAFSFAYAMGLLLLSPLSEKYGRKQLMLAGLVALAVITPVLGLFDSFLSMVVLRSVQGFAASAFAPAVLAYVVEMFPPEKRVTTIGFVSTGFLAAGIAGQVFSGLVSQNLGWTYVFYLLGGVYLLSALALAKFVPKTEIREKTVQSTAPFRQMGKLLFQKPLFFCYFITATLLFSFVGMYTVLGDYLSQPPISLDANQMQMVRAAGIVGMLLSPLAGRLVERWGMRRVLQGGLVLATVGIGLMGTSASLAFLTFMSVLFVAGISVSVPTLISLIGHAAGAARGLAVSLYTFILFIGATLGPIVSSSLLMTGSHLITFGVLAALLGAAFVSTFFTHARS